MKKKKGTCIRYSLVHSEGRILQKDDIWDNEVRISKRELKESAQIIAETERIKSNTVNAISKYPLKCHRVFLFSVLIDCFFVIF